MRRKGWHMDWQEDALVLARRWPARFDIGVETRLPQVTRSARLAHQVRQDIWRAMRGQRGFAPAVRVEALADGTRVVAGGELSAPLARGAAEARIAAVLASAENRARWVRWSR